MRTSTILAALLALSAPGLVSAAPKKAPTPVAKKAPLARLDQPGPQALEQVRRWGEQGEPAGEAQQ